MSSRRWVVSWCRAHYHQPLWRDEDRTRKSSRRTLPGKEPIGRKDRRHGCQEWRRLARGNAHRGRRIEHNIRWPAHNNTRHPPDDRKKLDERWDQLRKNHSPYVTPQAVAIVGPSLHLYRQRCEKTFFLLPGLLACLQPGARYLA